MYWNNSVVYTTSMLSIKSWLIKTNRPTDTHTHTRTHTRKHTDTYTDTHTQTHTISKNNVCHSSNNELCRLLHTTNRIQVNHEQFTSFISSQILRISFMSTANSSLVLETAPQLVAYCQQPSSTFFFLALNSTTVTIMEWGNNNYFIIHT